MSCNPLNFVDDIVPSISYVNYGTFSYTERSILVKTKSTAGPYNAYTCIL